MAELSLERFGEFFEAVHGSAPFPWQERLLAHISETGGWPETLDLPTGSGKTAALDIALFHLAMEAEGGRSRAAPLRIVMVVDRRTIVDQAYRRAEKLREALLRPQNSTVALVAQRLRSLSGAAPKDPPLAAVQLRGGMPRDDAWARRPDQPLIAASTVDQVGSRLLFRGYGVSDSMRPIHAGLLGNDTLFLLDEVHLARPFFQTLKAVGHYRSQAEAGPPNPWQVVALSATPGRSHSQVFSLSDEDRKDRILSKRLNAPKPLVLQPPVGVRGAESDRRHAFARAMAERASSHLAPGRAIGVVVNRVATARAIAKMLSETCGETAVVLLLTGRMRPLDRLAAENRIRPLIESGAAREARERPIVVVATQTIEAGADFDFDVMLSECASLDALRQRFGRLNRMGDAQEPCAEILIRSDALGANARDPVYGAAIAETWRWLEEKKVGDFGLERLPQLSEAELQKLLPPVSRAPVMLPAHLDAWVQTAPIPNPDPDVSLWLHGVERAGPPEVQVVWRAELSQSLLERALEGGDDNPEAVEAVRNRVEACPPSVLEALSLPLHAVQSWLACADEVELADVEGRIFEAEPMERQSVRRPVLVYGGEESAVLPPEEIRPGQTIVVPTSYGGLWRGNWDPTATETVEDLGTQARRAHSGRSVLRLLPALFLDYGPPPPAPAALDEDAERGERAIVDGWLRDLLAQPVESQLREVIEELLDEPRAALVSIDPVVLGEGDSAVREAGYFVLSGRKARRGGDITTEDDGASFTGVQVPLRAHLAGVGALARSFAERCGLPEALTRDLATAACWHDAGKVDPRFQRLLHGGSEFLAATSPEPLAKSTVDARDRRYRKLAQERSGYPRGARHELASLALLQALEAMGGKKIGNDPELIMHLVASHHGHCRPFAPIAKDAAPVELRFRDAELGGEVVTTSDHRLERLDSGVAERFWLLVERYGWYGLAWMEAILRLADHRQSESEQRHGGEGTP